MVFDDFDNNDYDFLDSDDDSDSDNDRGYILFDYYTTHYISQNKSYAPTCMEIFKTPNTPHQVIDINDNAYSASEKFDHSLFLLKLYPESIYTTPEKSYKEKIKKIAKTLKEIIEYRLKKELPIHIVIYESNNPFFASLFEVLKKLSLSNKSSIRFINKVMYANNPQNNYLCDRKNTDGIQYNSWNDYYYDALKQAYSTENEKLSLSLLITLYKAVKDPGSNFYKGKFHLDLFVYVIYLSDIFPKSKQNVPEITCIKESVQSFIDNKHKEIKIKQSFFSKSLKLVKSLKPNNNHNTKDEEKDNSQLKNNKKK